MSTEVITQRQESWKSRAGFIFAAAGSAVGLVNIWRFPYIVGQYGGGAFILVYLVFLALIGFPVLMSEVLIGRTGQSGPTRAFGDLSGKKRWRKVGMGITLTGFIVSSFYSVVAGWILGYLVQAARGGLTGLTTIESASAHFEVQLASGGWCVGYHCLFILLSVLVLVRGVRGGIEKANKILMPILFLLLIGLVIRGVTLSGGIERLAPLYTFDWSKISPMAILTALGHAFFTLSLGQGTMITYGSYLSKRDNIPSTCGPVVLFDTLVGLLAAVAVLSIVLAGGGSLTGGQGLLFSTLPTVFSSIPGGYLVGVAFFLLVTLAALTSQTSAMEPLINYFVQEKRWSRGKGVLIVGLGALLLGIPCALSFSLFSAWQIGGANLFEIVSFITMDILIPLGGLAAVLFVGWVWGLDRAFPNLFGETDPKGSLLRPYLYVCVRYVAPLLIGMIFLSNLGLV